MVRLSDVVSYISAKIFKKTNSQNLNNNNNNNINDTNLKNDLEKSPNNANNKLKIKGGSEKINWKILNTIIVADKTG